MNSDAPSAAQIDFFNKMLKKQHIDEELFELTAQIKVNEMTKAQMSTALDLLSKTETDDPSAIIQVLGKWAVTREPREEKKETGEASKDKTDTENVTKSTQTVANVPTPKSTTRITLYQEIAPNTWTDAQITLMKHYIADGFSDDEFQILLYTAWRTGLDPLRKQIWGWKQNAKLIIMTSIHGKIGKAMKSGNYNGYEIEKEYDEKHEIFAMTAKVYRKDVDRPFAFRALRSEYDKKQALWKEKPEMMLEKCALSMALSRAFPEEVGGLFVPEEFGSNAQRIESEVQ